MCNYFESGPMDKMLFEEFIFLALVGISFDRAALFDPFLVKGIKRNTYEKLFQDVQEMSFVICRFFYS